MFLFHNKINSFLTNETIFIIILFITELNYLFFQKREFNILFYKKELIPVEIDGKGTVKYANLKTKWYYYEEKKWANAVILTSTGKEKNYKTGDKIDEKDIESYFVWIPRYKYKIWDLGKYEKAYAFSDLKDSAETAENDYALRYITGKAQLIDIIFQKKEEKTTDIEGECAPSTTSGGGNNCQIGDYMTHPAFTLGKKDLSGIWVGKFEVTGNINNITVKPNNSPILSQTVGSLWNTLYNYRKGSNNHNSNLDPHMMKNIEWGAAAYLSHSTYGIDSKINVNNNSNYLTGYSATATADQSSHPGEYGSTKDKTDAWNTSTGYLASTTGNITGVYDMSGGAFEFVAAYNKGQNSSESNLSTELINYSEYFDVYEITTNWYEYDKRILGDATGEMGSFYNYYDKDGLPHAHNSWYGGNSNFVDSSYHWFSRGCSINCGILADQFAFSRAKGIMASTSTRLVLAVQ